MQFCIHICLRARQLGKGSSFPYIFYVDLVYPITVRCSVNPVVCTEAQLYFLGL